MKFFKRITKGGEKKQWIILLLQIDILLYGKITLMKAERNFSILIRDTLDRRVSILYQAGDSGLLATNHDQNFQ